MRDLGGRRLKFRLIGGCIATLVVAAALAADPDAFLRGEAKDCTGCDLAGRDLKERNFQRSRLDRVILRNADLTGASLFRSDGHVAWLTIETGAPTRDPAVLNRLFRERIEALRDPLDPGFGYDLIRLGVPRIEPLGPAQLQLEGGAIADVELAALLDRLGVRLGHNRLRRLVRGDSHIPEQAAFELPLSAPRPPACWPKLEPGAPPLRPLHLFDPPQRIDVIAEVPDGPPRRFRWRTKLHDVVRYEGPERIASEWWQRKKGYLPGQAGLTRDYYRVEDARGRRFWVFRHGLYAEEKASPDWYLHGLFA